MPSPRLIGRGADAYPTIARPAAAVENALPLPEHLPADLLSRRPDILAAQMRIRAAMRGREAAHADFYPNIDLTAALGFQAIGFGNLFSGDALTAGVGPGDSPADVRCRQDPRPVCPRHRRSGCRGGRL